MNKSLLITLLCTTIFSLFGMYYYKYKCAVLEGHLIEIQIKYDHIEKKINEAHKVNQSSQEEHDQRVKEIKSTSLPSECTDQLDWIVERLKKYSR